MARINALPRAPAFALHDRPYSRVALHDFRGRPVVLAFYVADWHPVATDQLAAYQALLPQLVLDVVTLNEAARRLYRSQGFRTYALERRAMKQGGEYYDVEHMSLWLEGESPAGSGAGEV